jgi:hypothetical protein
MALVMEKSSRRNRIQFSVSDEMYRKYLASQERAKALRAILDFNRDFEKWLDGQLDQTASKLSEIEQKRVQAAINKETVSFADLAED